MPFTASHVIAVVPLRRKAVPFLPLVIGCMAPDYFYFLPSHVGSYYSHKSLVIFLMTLPMAWLVLWIFRHFLREPLLLLLPEHHQPLAAELAGDPPTDSRWARPWATALLLLAGISTHLLWDSFTHPDGFMVEYFESLRTTMIPTPIGPLALNRVLQHGCSFAGLGGLALWYLWLLRRQKPDGLAPAANATVQLPHRVRRNIRLALLAAGAITAGVVLCYRSAHPEPNDTMRGHVMKSVWSAITYGIMAFAIAVGAYCAAWRLRRRTGKNSAIVDQDQH